MKREKLAAGQAEQSHRRLAIAITCGGFNVSGGQRIIAAVASALSGPHEVRIVVPRDGRNRSSHFPGLFRFCLLGFAATDLLYASSRTFRWRGTQLRILTLQSPRSAVSPYSYGSQKGYGGATVN